MHHMDSQQNPCHVSRVAEGDVLEEILTYRRSGGLSSSHCVHIPLSHFPAMRSYLSLGSGPTLPKGQLRRYFSEGKARRLAARIPVALKLNESIAALV